MTQWPGWSQENSLILPLDDAPPVEPMEIEGRRFEPKQELHVTLIGSRLGDELRAVLGERLDAAIRPAFEALDWSVRRTGETVLIEKAGITDAGERGTVASIIEHIELPALAFFHRWLGELLGRQLPVPPPHVTLYTAGKAKGIGIPTARALRQHARREAVMPS